MNNDELIIEPANSPYAGDDTPPGFTITSEDFHAVELLSFRGTKLNTSPSRYNTLLAFVNDQAQSGTDVTSSPLFAGYIVYICLQDWEKLVGYHDNWTLFKSDFLKWTDEVGFMPGTDDDEVGKLGEQVFDTFQQITKVDTEPGEPGAVGP